MLPLLRHLFTLFSLLALLFVPFYVGGAVLPEPGEFAPPALLWYAMRWAMGVGGLALFGCVVASVIMAYYEIHDFLTRFYP